jgi:hypothetical protein
MLGHLVSNAFPAGMAHRPSRGLLYRLWKLLFRR